MLRSIILGVANRRAVRSAVTGDLGSRVVRRFVAGETLRDAVDVVRTLNASGVEASLDHLGENVTDAAQAAAAAGVYVEALTRIGGEGLRANVSVKLTQMGLDVATSLAVSNTDAVVAAARGAGATVTLDMEDHRYTERTIEICLALNASHPGAVGVAIQAYLKRTPADLEVLTAAGVPVRLCKGAYKEPRTIALRKREEVDAAFARAAGRLMGSQSYPMIATHDQRLIDHVRALASARETSPEAFEFQMLYGVRRELQRRLVAQGYRMRVYVPFGSQWYPYLMRRIAERPANVRFFAEALVRR